MAGVVFWFRQDLRLLDQLALSSAIEQAQRLGGWLLPVFIHEDRFQTLTPWGFKRSGVFRNAWMRQAVHDLSAKLQSLGSTLLEAEGDPVALLTETVRALSDPLLSDPVLGGPLLVCEEIAAPEEQAQIEALRRHGVTVKTIWQSTLMAPESLPLPPKDLPDRFTSFRQILERHGVKAAAPLPETKALPPLPAGSSWASFRASLPSAFGVVDTSSPKKTPVQIDARSAVPWDASAFSHLSQYCDRGLPHTYKATRNGLMGIDYSSKWSPWLATGALSARTAWAAIAEFESVAGASDSSYWLFFELLWRDHFRWLHLKHGRRLYAAQGLNQAPKPPHDPEAFSRWCVGETGHPFIDAGMRELAATGYLSNRMRQNVASYLIHDLACDWRAGAAWFESCLIDFDVYNNQGNWLYLSGRGTDPRPQRRFNPELQAKNYDPDGAYRQLWAA